MVRWILNRVRDLDQPIVKIPGPSGGYIESWSSTLVLRYLDPNWTQVFGNV